MAKSSKKTGKRLTQKAKKIVRSDVFTSVAIVSILFNIMFLVCVFVLTSTDAFNRNAFESVRSRYCQNVEAIRERAEQLGSGEAAVKEWRVSCITKEFKPFYNEAVKKFEAQQVN